MINRTKIMIIFLFLFSLAHSGANHPELDWRTLESDHFLVHYHDGAKRTAEAALEIAEFVYLPTTEMYQYTPDQKTHIIIKDTDDFSNGSAFFFDNKIEIWANPLDFDLRGTHDWIKNVITHEFIHIIQLGASLKHNRHFPAFYIQSMGYEDEKRKDVLYGYPNAITSYAIPSITVPPWFAEGVAQTMFDEANYDFWDTHRDMILRDAFMNNTVFGINELSSFGKTGIGNEQIYNQGYALAKYFVNRFGYEILFSISKYISSPIQYSFPNAVENATGFELNTIYSDWYSEMTSKYETYIDRTYSMGDVIIEDGTVNIHPTWSPENRTFAYLSNSEKDYFGQTDLYIYNFTDSSSKKIDSGVFSCPLWINDSTIVYSKKSKPNKYGSKYYDLYLSTTNKKKNKPKRLSVDMRLTSPSLNAKGDRLAAVGIADGTSNIYEANFDLDSLDVIVFSKKTNYRAGEKIFSLTYKNEQLIFDLLDKDHGRDLYSMNLLDSQITVVKNEIWDERDPDYSDSLMVYSSDLSGVYNIFTSRDGESTSISDVSGGAFMPSISGNKILYSLYDEGKYKIAVLDITYKSRQLSPSYDNFTYSSMEPTEPLNIRDRKYNQELSKPFIFPRVLFDYGTIKPGFYFYASDPLDKYFLFGGASRNKIEDLDLFLLFELKKYYPTLYANFYWVTRNLSREDNPTSIEGQVFDNINFRSNDTYIMFSADLGSKVSFKGNNFTFNYNYSKYTAHSQGFTQISHNNEVQNSYPFDLTYDYYRGHKFTLGHELKNYSYRYAFNMIPQNGFQINTDISIEKNQFDPSFEVSEDYGTLSLVFSNHDTYRFNSNLKKNTMIIKSRRVALNQNLQLGYLSNKKVDDFFYYFGGGLTGLRGYTFYDKKLSGTEVCLFTNALRTPIFLEKNYKLLNLLIQNLSLNYIIQSGIANRCNEDGCGDIYHSNGIEFRINGSSFYSFPFALSYQIHRPLFEEDKSEKHYLQLLFEFME
tara:strand:- start:2563 stop:5520 length:2958 start_codon:yes stop_codon:yes gene_type:complete